MGGAGNIILRSTQEISDLKPNDLWEEIGVAWSGPTEYGSLPEGFILNRDGIYVDIGADIFGMADESGVYFGTGEEEDFRPIVCLMIPNVEAREALLSLIDTLADKQCSQSEES